MSKYHFTLFFSQVLVKGKLKETKICNKNPLFSLEESGCPFVISLMIISIICSQNYFAFGNSFNGTTGCDEKMGGVSIYDITQN